MNLNAILDGYPKLGADQRRVAMMVGVNMTEQDFRRAMRNVYGEPVPTPEDKPTIGAVEPLSVMLKRGSGNARPSSDAVLNRVFKIQTPDPSAGIRTPDPRSGKLVVMSIAGAVPSIRAHLRATLGN